MSDMNKEKRYRELVKVLNDASEAYYQKNIEKMSNYEYDALYDELLKLEWELGRIDDDSPSQKVGYEVSDQLPKERHAKRMLSLDKTKSKSTLASWLKDQEGFLSWKLDGLTVVLTYEGGRLKKAVTRGNGEIGEVITPNARTFVNIPKSIPFQGRLVVRGEAFIKYSDFEKINAEIPELDAKYKNPRNLCSGSVRQKDSSITAKRRVNIQLFSLSEVENADVSADKAWGQIYEPINSIYKQLEWLKGLGFDVVYGRIVNAENIYAAIEDFQADIENMDIPSDGLVLEYDDIEYGEALGETSKFPRNAIAFKWKDEEAQTRLDHIKWSTSRTGLINPIAIFDPVDLEGTTVSRASVHNLSILKQLELGEGDQIVVYKANMIIPQIADNLTRSATIGAPDSCEVCGGDAKVVDTEGVEVVYCTNPNCPAKMLKAFEHFTSRDAMNIENLSEATIQTFIDEGFIHSFGDIFRLSEHRSDIIGLRGFGEKSYNNLINSIERARKTTATRLLYSLGIENIGVVNARNIAQHCGGDIQTILNLSKDELQEIDGVGEVLADAVVNYFKDSSNRELLEDLLSEIQIEKPETLGAEEGGNTLEGITVVITGSLELFENRAELSEEIRKHGGKTTGSVSKNTDFLVNNDIESTSSKNRKAKELGVKIINERDFVKIMQGMEEKR